VPRTLGSGVRHEQRLWQQLSFAGPVVGGWTPTARLRLEQRWLEPWAGTSHRVRVLARTQRTLGATSPWGLFTYNETMFTLDRTPRGPARGFDRNRLSGGVVRHLGDHSHPWGPAQRARAPGRAQSVLPALTRPVAAECSNWPE
jgi:Protein of unknown function (DUF2490)